MKNFCRKIFFCLFLFLIYTNVDAKNPTCVYTNQETGKMITMHVIGKDKVTVDGASSNTYYYITISSKNCPSLVYYCSPADTVDEKSAHPAYASSKSSLKNLLCSAPITYSRVDSLSDGDNVPKNNTSINSSSKITGASPESGISGSTSTNGATGTTNTTTNSGSSEDVNTKKVDCTLFGDPDSPSDVAYWIQKTLNIMRYIAIVALIALSSIDFIKAVVSQDGDALKKAGTTFAKRLVFCILIFFIPTILNFLLSFLNVYGTCNNY